jgi:nucleoside-diphosphate-sugar epimerase
MAALAFAHAIAARSPVRIFTAPGGAELARDFTYVDDIVSVCTLTLSTNRRVISRSVYAADACNVYMRSVHTVAAILS